MAGKHGADDAAHAASKAFKSDAPTLWAASEHHSDGITVTLHGKPPPATASSSGKVLILCAPLDKPNWIAANSTAFNTFASAKLRDEGYTLVVMATVDKLPDKAIALPPPSALTNIVLSAYPMAVITSSNRFSAYPMKASFAFFEKLFGVPIDRQSSLVVGSDAGKVRPKDKANEKDRKFAANIGIPFRNAAEFTDATIAGIPYTPKWFDPRTITSSQQPPAPSIAPSDKQEMMLNVGPPGAGKSTWVLVLYAVLILLTDSQFDQSVCWARVCAREPRYAENMAKVRFSC